MIQGLSQPTTQALLTGRSSKTYYQNLRSRKMIKSGFSYTKLMAAGAVLAMALIPGVRTSTATSHPPVPFDDVCGGENTRAVEALLKNWADECIKEIGANPPADKNARTKLCLAADKFQKLVPRLRAMANNGPFTVGPRDLMLGTSQSGDIINPAVRTFLSPTPVDKDSVTVEVTKKSGKGGAVIRICKIDENKKFTNLKNITFEDGDNSPVTKKETVSGVKGDLVQVFIDGTGGPGKAFLYTLKTSQ